MVHASPLLLVVPADNDDGEDDAQLLALYDGDTWILRLPSMDDLLLVTGADSMYKLLLLMGDNGHGDAHKPRLPSTVLYRGWPMSSSDGKSSLLLLHAWTKFAATLRFERTRANSMWTKTRFIVELPHLTVIDERVLRALDYYGVDYCKSAGACA